MTNVARTIISWTNVIITCQKWTQISDLVGGGQIGTKLNNISLDKCYSLDGPINFLLKFGKNHSILAAGWVGWWCWSSNCLAEVEAEVVNTNLHEVQLVYWVCLEEMLGGERVVVTNWGVLQQILFIISSDFILDF